jgi:iron complex transport system substrate-binding protein
LRGNILRKAVVVLVAVAFVGCGREQTTASAPTASPSKFPLSLTTSAGTITLPSAPKRIVSLSPTATEMLFAIDAGSQVVAVDDQSNYPPYAPKTKLSGFQPNVEAIAAYKPDLVVYDGSAKTLAPGLAAIGIAVLAEPAAKTFENTYTQIDQLGEATGHAGKASELVATMRSEIQDTVARARRFKRPLTYYHELDNTYFTVTSTTFIGQVYKLLGLQNIADAADKSGSGYPQLSAEYIIKASPDLIFLADTKCCKQSAQTVAARPGWSNIAAVKSHEVIALDDDIASRWGPRVVDFVRTVEQSLETAKAP